MSWLALSASQELEVAVAKARLRQAEQFGGVRLIAGMCPLSELTFVEDVDIDLVMDSMCLGIILASEDLNMSLVSSRCLVVSLIEAVILAEVGVAAPWLVAG